MPGRYDVDAVLGYPKQDDQTLAYQQL